MSDLHLVGTFHTIQGEGFHSGRRALFVRLPFCNLACEWCDTQFDKFEKWSEERFITFAQQEKHRFAVITGGEPMLHKHTPRVVSLLKGLGFEIACESNGTVPPVAGIDFVTISPKRQAADKGMDPYFVCPEAMENAREFKYVVDDKFDFSILDRHDADDGRRYSLSPEFGQFDKNVEKILAYVKESPLWRISLQTHKFLNVP